MVSEFITPDWVQDAVFYQIFPDRFASSREVQKPARLEAWDAPPTNYGFKGGDLLGVLEHLDYLQDLGVNAIYFTPIFQSASNHRYHTHDYLQVDPLLGGNAAFERLLKEAHRRGLRVVLDGVFNHASRGFFQFNHLLETGASSPYRDWFRVKRFPLHAYEGKPNYDCWWNMAALPEFNHRNPEVRRFIFDVARYWIDQGADGWRLDVPFCIDDDSFWQEFRRVVKGANPQAYITGEIASDASRWLQGDQFDAVMNYLLAYCCWGFFGGEAVREEHVGAWINHARAWMKPAAQDFAASVEGLLSLYPRPAVLAQMNLLSSHDTARFLTMMGGDRSLLKLATLFQMTYPGAPCIYYGNEIGMEGSHDPDCRRAFPWDESRWDQDLLAFFCRLAHLRRERAVLRRGDYHTLFAQDGVVAYARCLGGETAVVVLNRSARSLELDLPVPAGLNEGALLHDALGGGAAQVKAQRLHLPRLAPQSGLLLV